MAHEEYEGTFVETKAFLAAQAGDQGAVLGILADCSVSELVQLVQACATLADAAYMLHGRALTGAKL